MPRGPGKTRPIAPASNSSIQPRCGKERAMNRFFGWMAAIMICVVLSGIATAQEPGGTAQSATGPQRMQDRLTREVFHELVTLPQLTIFDNLQYKVDGSKVTLTGQVVNAVL